jgi:hypothetical protein
LFLVTRMWKPCWCATKPHSGATEELLEWKSSGSRSRKPRLTAVGQKLPLYSPTRGGGSVGIVRSRTKAAELSFFLVFTKASTWTQFLAIWIQSTTSYPMFFRSMLILFWNQGVGLFQNRVFRGIFEPKRGEMTGG